MPTAVRRAGVGMEMTEIYGQRRPEVQVLPDAEALASFAAESLAAEIRQAVSTRGEAVVAVPGGGTPRRALEALARQARVSWARVVVLPGDERMVEVDDPDSNEGMIRRALVDQIAGPRPMVLSWQVETGLGPTTVAHRFEGRLLGVIPYVEGRPQLDSLTLGLGEDGHTASLFPGAVYPAEAVVLATKSPTGQSRLSLGPRILGSAKRVHFLVEGAEKAAVLAEVVAGDYDPARLPAQLIARNFPGCVIWCDAAAGSRLDRRAP